MCRRMTYIFDYNLIVKIAYRKIVGSEKMIREINVKELTDNISEMCIQANHYLSPDMDACMKQAVETEKSELGKKIPESASGKIWKLQIKR